MIMKKLIIYLWLSLIFLLNVTLITLAKQHPYPHQNFPPHYEDRFRNLNTPPVPQTASENTKMSGNEIIDLVQNLGPVFVICMAAFWFIKYQSDRMKEIQDEFMKKDSEADNRVFEILEKNHEVISNHTASLEANTKSMDALISAIGQRKGSR